MATAASETTRRPALDARGHGRRRRLVAPGLAFAMATALATALAPSPAAAEDFRAGDTARLDAGEIILRTTEVAGSELPRATVWAVIDAPLARIWAVIDRCADYKRTMVRVLASEELSRKGDVVTCRITVDMPWPFDDLTATTRATHTIDPGKRHRRAWTLVEGDYKRNEGSWTFVPWQGAAERTLAIYSVHAEPNIAIPVAIQRRASRTTLPNLITQLRKVSGAKPRP